MTARLDAFLAHAGVGSRQDVKRLIRAGKVTVRGEVCKDAGAKITDEVVTCNDVVICARERDVLLAMHKPVGYSCSHDPREAPTAFELILDAYAGLDLEMVGRLDRDTSGLLLLTDDGALIQRLTHPRRHLVKRYRAHFSGTLAKDAVARFEKGILLHEETEPTLPARLELDRNDGSSGRATIYIHEGRYHQVRRMLAAVGGTVTALHRDRIGELDLPPDLEAGSCRPLTAEERSLLSPAKSSES